jgi:hypothetical protein
MTRRVTTIAEAGEVLGYFNGFHDGFIKRLTVISHDEFEDRDTQYCHGAFDVAIVFAHCNYQADTRPHTQLIEAKFNRVKDLSIAFSGQSHEWAIVNLSVTEATRSSLDGSIELCLKATLLQHRLKDGREWVIHEDLSFTFAEATFDEVQ